MSNYDPIIEVALDAQAKGPEFLNAILVNFPQDTADAIRDALVKIAAEKAHEEALKSARKNFGPLAEEAAELAASVAEFFAVHYVGNVRTNAVGNLAREANFMTPMGLVKIALVTKP